MKTKKMEGQNIFGKKRVYKFNLIDANTGLRMFHEQDFMVIMATAADVLAAIEDSEVDGMGKASMAGMFTATMGWGVVEEMFKSMLAGTVVETEDGTKEFNEMGKIDLGPMDPTEQYVALAHAFMANFPDYASFFGVAVEGSDQRKTKTETAQE